MPVEQRRRPTTRPRPPRRRRRRCRRGARRGPGRRSARSRTPASRSGTRAPCRCACSIIAMRAAPDAMRPPPAWNTTVPSKRMPGQRSAATAGREQLGGHALLVERGDDVGDAGRVAVVDRAGGHDEPDAGLVLEVAPLGERLPAPADPERIRVAEPEDPRRAVGAAAGVAVLELLEHLDAVTAPGELPGRRRAGHAGTDDDDRASGHGGSGYGGERTRGRPVADARARRCGAHARTHTTRPNG